MQQQSEYKPATRCPWSGVECDCKKFPWLEGSCVPVKCANEMQEKLPAMLEFRKVAKNAHSASTR